LPRRLASGLLTRLLILGLAALAAWWWGDERAHAPLSAPGVVASGPGAGASVVTVQVDALADVFSSRRSDVQVGGLGRVVKVLADDEEGDRHQRFVLALASGQTLLVAHNIDLAPRIPGLAKGDLVRFYGEYAWNARGGIIHWTHRDPQGRHPAGWLEHAGKRYQ
jgi:hypothetical protein